NNPEIRLNVDRSKAGMFGLSERDVAYSVLTSLSSSFQVAPNFWVNPNNGVNYNLAVQTPTYDINSLDDIMQTALTSPSQPRSQLLANVATAYRDTTSAIVSHYRIQGVFDVFANVQNRDLGGVIRDVDNVLAQIEAKLPRGSFIRVRGQANSMNAAFTGLFSGLFFALVLVYLLLAVNFQSWTDPLIILMAIPGAFCGIVWGLFITQTSF